MALLVAHRKFMATTGTAAGNHILAIGGAHPLAEAVLVAALAQRGLEGAFHRRGLCSFGGRPIPLLTRGAVPIKAAKIIKMPMVCKGSLQVFPQHHFGNIRKEKFFEKHAK